MNGSLLSGTVVLAAFLAWLYARGRERRNLFRSIKGLGLTFYGNVIPAGIPIRNLSFVAKEDRIEDLVMGTAQGIPVVIFTLIAPAGETLFEQTVAAFKTDIKTENPAALLRASELAIERADDWLFVSRNRERVKGADLPEFLSECLSYVMALK